MIAADTSSVIGGIVMEGRVKIARAEDGRLIGAAGLCGYCEAFRAWALKEDGEAPNSKDSIGFIVDLDGTIRIWDSEEGGGPYRIKPPYFAAGSGAEYAMGAMHANATAEQAVRAAIAHDKSTNGDVLVLPAGVMFT